MAAQKCNHIPNVASYHYMQNYQLYIQIFFNQRRIEQSQFIFFCVDFDLLGLCCTDMSYSDVVVLKCPESLEIKHVNVQALDEALNLSSTSYDTS